MPDAAVPDTATDSSGDVVDADLPTACLVAGETDIVFALEPARSLTTRGKVQADFVATRRSGVVFDPEVVGGGLSFDGDTLVSGPASLGASVKPYIATAGEVTIEVYHLAIRVSGVSVSYFLNGERFLDRSYFNDFLQYWDTSHVLMLGNENLGTAGMCSTSPPRPWKGRIFYAAIHDRALSVDELKERHDCMAGIF